MESENAKGEQEKSQTDGNLETRYLLPRFTSLLDVVHKGAFDDQLQVRLISAQNEVRFLCSIKEVGLMSPSYHTSTIRTREGAGFRGKFPFYNS